MAIAPPVATAVPAGVPKTGHMSEEMAVRVATNIAADLGRGGHVDRLTQGVWAHYMKGAFERFYLEKFKRDLPSTHFGW